jgi:hypothetical protein
MKSRRIWIDCLIVIAVWIAVALWACLARAECPCNSCTPAGNVCTATVHVEVAERPILHAAAAVAAAPVRLAACLCERRPRLLGRLAGRWRCH